jgi:outer membrane lipoprotein-sorting protein
MSAWRIILALGLMSMLSRADDAGSPATAKDIVEKARATYAALSSYNSTGETTTAGLGIPQTTTFTMRLQRPSQYRVDWTSPMGGGSVWSDGKGDFLSLLGHTEMQKNRMMALASATGVSGSAAATIPGTFFVENWGDALSPGIVSTLEPDERVNTVDCFVVSSQIKPPAGGTMTRTLWIGKADHLIHQSRTKMDSVGQVVPKFTDEQVVQMLKMQNKAVTPEAIAAMRTQVVAETKNAAEMMKGRTITFTQTQENISTNKKFAAADFDK